MKFISTFDFVFSGREGRSVFNEKPKPTSNVRNLEQAEKQRNARDTIKEISELSKSIMTPELELKSLLDLSKAETILENGGSSSDVTKGMRESIKKMSNTSLEIFIHTFPKEAKALFTNSLDNNSFKINFYDNTYLNKQIPLESLLTYKDKFVQKGSDIGMWTANGYMILDKEGNITHKRIKVLNGDNIKILSRDFVEEKYPDKYFPSMETDRTVDIRRRINFSTLQDFKDTIDKTNFEVRAMINKYLYNRELTKLKNKVNDMDRSLDPIEYSKKINEIKKIFFEQKNEEEIPLPYEEFNKKVKNMDVVANSLNKDFKSYFDCGDKECSLFVDSLLAIKGVCSPYGKLLTIVEINKKVNEYVKPEDQEKVKYLIQKISFFNVKKLTTVRNYFISTGEEDTTANYERYINKYIQNTSMNLGDRFQAIKEKEEKEQAQELGELINKVLEMEDVFAQGPDDNNPTKLLKNSLDLITNFSKNNIQKLGENAVSVVFRLERTYSSMPEGENKKKLGELIHKINEKFSSKKLELDENKNKDLLEISEKNIIRLLGEKQANEFFDLIGKKPDRIILAEFITSVLKENHNLNESEIKDLLEKHYELIIKKGALNMKKIISKRIEVSIENKDMIRDINKVFISLEKNNFEFLKFVKENDGPEHLRIFTLVNREEVEDLKELINEYLELHPNDASILKLKSALVSDKFNEYHEKIKELDAKYVKQKEDLTKLKEISELIDSSQSLDEFIQKVEKIEREKKKKEKKKEEAKSLYYSAVGEESVDSLESQEAITKAIKIEEEFTGIKLIKFNEVTHEPVYRIGRTKQGLTVNSQNKMRPTNIDQNGPMAEYREVEAKPENLPVLQIYSAMSRANKMTPGTIGMSDGESLETLGIEKTQNMIRQIYPWGAQRPLSDNEVTGWAYSIDKVGTIDEFWKIMGATYDEDGGLIDEKGKDIRFRVMAAVEASRNNNFDWLDKYEKVNNIS